MTLPAFSSFFSTLWPYDLFRWQRLLAERLVVGEWPRKALDLPPAAGNTKCLGITVCLSPTIFKQAQKPVSKNARRCTNVFTKRVTSDVTIQHTARCM